MSVTLFVKYGDNDGYWWSVKVPGAVMSLNDSTNTCMSGHIIGIFQSNGLSVKLLP